MPTENRSSNTDPRDVFIRLNPLGLGEAELRKDSTGFDDQRTHSDYLLFLAGYRESQQAQQHNAEPGYPPCDYCGITHDYHPWHGSGLINGFENRHIHACDGCRGQLPSHPGQPHPEPIAWMVGTAFWWNKEEAERDSAAMGLSIVGLGPMTGIAPAEQHQCEPVAIVTMGANDKAVIELLSHGLKIGTELYDRADPGEVERLRTELTRMNEVNWKASQYEIKLQAKLAERDALLTRMKGLFRVDDPFELHDAVCSILANRGNTD